MPNPESDPSLYFQRIFNEEEARKRLAVTQDSKERQDLLKMLVGWALAKRVKNGDKIGIGSGTTSEAAIRAIGQRMALDKDFKVSGVATSKKLSKLASNLGIIMDPFEETLTRESTIKDLNWGFDGADEVELIFDEEGRLKGFAIIKGGGGAHTIERAVAKRCKEWIVIVDESKIVDQLGAFPVAVEVDPNEEEKVRQIFLDKEKYNAQSAENKINDDGNLFVTDKGNHILKVLMGEGKIKDEWEQEWRTIPGVIDTGLFINEVKICEVMVARENGEIEIFKPALVTQTT